MRKDAIWIVSFVALGLGIAYFTAAPLRHPRSGPGRRLVGTPLNSGETLYAQGTVALAPGFEARAREAAALFVIAKPIAGGPPVAVKRFESPIFPVTFSLTTSDSMVGGGFFDGDIQVTARLDQDGVAGPRQPGDVESIVTISKGQSRAVQITMGQNRM